MSRAPVDGKAAHGCPDSVTVGSAIEGERNFGADRLLMFPVAG
jgi:hypothetical protein